MGQTAAISPLITQMAIMVPVISLIRLSSVTPTPMVPAIWSSAPRHLVYTLIAERGLDLVRHGDGAIVHPHDGGAERRAMFVGQNECFTLCVHRQRGDLTARGLQFGNGFFTHHHVLLGVKFNKPRGGVGIERVIHPLQRQPIPLLVKHRCLQ